MNFQEFVEALFRIADKITLPTLKGAEANDLSQRIKHIIHALAK